MAPKLIDIQIEDKCIKMYMSLNYDQSVYIHNNYYAMQYRHSKTVIGMIYGIANNIVEACPLANSILKVDPYSLTYNMAKISNSK